MTNNNSTPWIQRSTGQTIMWVFSIIGVIATVITTLPLVTGPRTELKATYRVSPFVMPDRLLKQGYLDTLVARQDTLLLKFYNILRSRSSTEQQIRMLDSLGSYESSYNTEEEMKIFAVEHRYFCLLTVENDGDKSFNPLQVLLSPNSDGVYEYTDSDGRLQKGRTAGKFSIGDLAPTEKREIYIWGQYSAFSQGVTIVYADGKVQAERPEEVTGIISWALRNANIITPILAGIITMIIATAVAKAQVNRANAAIAEANKQQEDNQGS